MLSFFCQSDRGSAGVRLTRVVPTTCLNRLCIGPVACLCFPTEVGTNTMSRNARLEEEEEEEEEEFIRNRERTRR